MKKVVENPVMDEIRNNMIKAIFLIIDGCVKGLRIAVNQDMTEKGDNYYRYKTNFRFINKALASINIDCLSFDDSVRLKRILEEINLLSRTFNVKISLFNEEEKRKNIFERTKLKKFKDINVKTL